MDLGSWAQSAVGGSMALALPVPLLTGVASAMTARVVRLLRRHQQAVQRVGGLMMVLVGVLLVTGLWTLLTSRLLIWVAAFRPVI